MKYWYDTEFYEDGVEINLISIGIVSEDGRSLYMESADFQWADVHRDHWLWENVYPHLTFERESKQGIARAVHKFITNGYTEHNNELWAYYASYDHVVLAQLFGKMVDMPEGIPWFTNDVKQELERLRRFDSCIELPKQASTEHHALADAEWTKLAYDYIQEMQWIGGDC